jgi:hypothetical protein
MEFMAANLLRETMPRSEGTIDRLIRREFSIVPSERDETDAFPTVETVGYFQMSLRDSGSVGAPPAHGQKRKHSTSPLPSPPGEGESYPVFFAVYILSWSRMSADCDVENFLKL